MQDGGQIWIVQDVIIFSEWVIVLFMDENIGYVVVFRDLYKIIDGGVIWMFCFVNVFGSYMDQVEIIDEDCIVFFQGVFIVYVMVNGGQMVDCFIVLFYGYNYQYLIVLFDGWVWLVCSYGFIVYFDDGGFNYID